MRLQVRFQGRVQGVGFRATSQFCARGLAITGFVRNEPDGSVLLEAQGGQDEIDVLLSRIAERMRGNISRTDHFELPLRTDELAFTIQR